MIAHRDHNPRPATKASVMVHYPVSMGRQPDFYSTPQGGAQRVKTLVRRQGLKLARINCFNGVIWCWMEPMHQPLSPGYQSSTVLKLWGMSYCTKVQGGKPVMGQRIEAEGEA